MLRHCMQRVPDISKLILMGHVVVQLVGALYHKPEGLGFDSRWCYCNFSLT